MSCAVAAVRNAESRVKDSYSLLLTPYSLPFTLHFSSLLPDFLEQLLPFLVFFFIFLHGHARLGVEALEVGLVHRAIEAIFAEKLLAIGAEQKISEQQSRVGMRRVGRQTHTTGIGWNQIHRHPLDRRAFRNGNSRVAEKNRRRKTELTRYHHIENRSARDRMQADLLRLQLLHIFRPFGR